MEENEKNIELTDIESRVISHDGVVRSDEKDDSAWRCFSCCGNKSENLNVMPFVLNDADSSQKILVLDLDETLVHCSFYPPDHYDMTVPITFDSVQYDVFIQKRPFLDEFFSEILPLFYVVVFTASLMPYANPILDKIIPQLPNERRLFRESCTYLNGMYVKDLELFNSPLSKIIIVDNNPCSFVKHPANGLLSATWMGEKDDTELIDRILPILKRCVDADDVRSILAEYQKPTNSFMANSI
jgi:Dullard-like phosphatase family protein